MLHYMRFELPVYSEERKIVPAIVELSRIFSSFHFADKMVEVDPEDVVYLVTVKKPYGVTKFLPVSLDFSKFFVESSDYDFSYSFDSNNLFVLHLFEVDKSMVDFKLFLTEDFSFVLKLKKKKMSEIVVNNIGNDSSNSSNANSGREDDFIRLFGLLENGLYDEILSDSTIFKKLILISFACTAWNNSNGHSFSMSGREFFNKTVFLDFADRLRNALSNGRF